MYRVRTVYTRLKDFLVDALAFMTVFSLYCLLLGFPDGLMGTLITAFGCFVGLVMLSGFWGRVSRGAFLAVHILTWAGIGAMLSREAWWPMAIPVGVFLLWLMYLHAKERRLLHDIA